MNKKTIPVLVTLLGLALACNFSELGTSAPTTDQPNQPGPGQPSTPLPSPTPVPSDPVAIHEGLASLNSYTEVMEWKSSGPGQADHSVVRIETQQDRSQDTKLVHYTITQPPSEGDTEPSTMDSYNYSIGTAKCSGNEEDGWEYSQSNPQEQEMSDLLRMMTDVVPLIDNPVFVGSENINGVATNHFTFQVANLGLESGAEVKANQGDYWLAQDGQYIVKYQLIIETLDLMNQTTMRMEVLIDLTNINKPVDIAFPAGCVP
jgi:hypothetical protein